MICLTVVLYSTNCSRCQILERKLHQANLDFTKITQFDAQDFIDKGFYSAPILEVDGEYMKYADAVQFINNLM